MDVLSTPRKRDKMAAQLTWLANKDILNLPEDRRHERVVPDNRHSTVVARRRPPLQLQDHRHLAVRRRHRARCPAGAGTPITLGRMRARVIRHFQNGVGVEFTSAQEMLTVVQQNLRID